MRTIKIALLCISFLMLASCLRKPPSPEPDLWEKVADFEAINNIRKMYTSPLELFLISDNEFVRLGVDNQAIEKRQLAIPFRLFGRPALAEHTFFRMIRNDDGEHELNFHLTKNADPVYKIELKDFQADDDTGLLVPSSGRNLGAYNAAGTQFLLPAIQLPGSYYVFFLFDIELDLSNAQFVSIELNKRIELPELPADPDNLINVRYVKGNYYVTTLDGAARIAPSTGTAEKIFTQWMLDFFSYQNKLYVTSFASDELQISEDNGLTWTPVALPQPLGIRMVEVINNQVFSQEFVGKSFSLADESLQSLDPIKLDSDMPDNPAAYADIAYFYGRYYLSAFKELYTTEELQVEE